MSRAGDPSPEGQGSDVLDDRFSRAALESLDPEDGAAGPLPALLSELERIALRLFLDEGADGVRRLVASLNSMGHELAPAPATGEGWASFVGATNDGTRAFWIHVGGEPACAMVLHHETLDAGLARRRASLIPEERARAELQDSFYDRGSELVSGGTEYDALEPRDRRLLCLYLLDTGVSNGGFLTWLANTDAALVEDATKYLDEVGATDLGAVLRDLKRLLRGGDSVPQAELEGRAPELSALDERYLASPDDLAMLVMTRSGAEG